MAKYIGEFPAPLLDDLASGAWLPIVGAGFSRNADYGERPAPVSWAEMGSALGQAVPGTPSDASPIEAISAFEHAYGRVALVDQVGTLIGAHHARPGRAHLAFARVGFTDVLTTNFDFLLERAYDQIRKSCMPIIDEAQLSAPNRAAGPRIMKFHGDLHHPQRLVLTEDDYDNFLSTYPLLATTIAAMLVNHTGVLIGYSLDDPDTRQLLALVRMRLGSMRRPLWTVQFEALPHTIARFERRGVKVVNLRRARGQSLADAFAQLFEELAEYWEARLPAMSVASDDRVAADLQLPKEDGRRLCYFAIPSRLIGWYRDNVFPEVESRGLVPVVAREVFTAPGSVATKIDALIDRAVVVVAELGSDSESYEAAIALSRKGPKHVLLIRGDTDIGRLAGPPNILSGPITVSRPPLDVDPEAFVRSISQWLSNVLPSRPDFRDEPNRLIDSGHFGPALISAVSLLEVSLTQAISRKQDEITRASLRQLVREARRMNLIQSDGERERIELAIAKRNEAVHSAATVSAAEARAGVAAIMVVVDRTDLWR